MSWFKKGPTCPIKTEREEDGLPIVTIDTGKGQRLLKNDISEPIKACYAELDNKGYPEKQYIQAEITYFQRYGRDTTSSIKANDTLTDSQYREWIRKLREKYRNLLKNINTKFPKSDKRGDKNNKTIVSDYVTVLYWENYADAYSSYEQFKASNKGKAFKESERKKLHNIALASSAARYMASMSASRSTNPSVHTPSVNHNIANLERQLGYAPGTASIRTPVNGYSLRPTNYAGGKRHTSRKSSCKHYRNRTRKY